MKLTVVSVFLVVTAAALVGMVLGGAFGCAAGLIGPDLFKHVVPWEDMEPVGTATVLGAAVGVLLGGGLGVFGVLMQFLAQWILQRRSDGRTAAGEKQPPAVG